MIDLDAARAARREAAGEPPCLTFGGIVFELPVELPFDIGRTMISMLQNIESGAAAVFDDITTILRPLLGIRYDEFMKLGPSMADLMALLDGIPKEYGFKDMGESQASESSSPSTSRPSKPISSPAMAST